MQAKTALVLSLMVLLVLVPNFSFIPEAQAASVKLTKTRNLAGYYSTAGTFPLVQAEAGIVEQAPGVYINALFDDGSDGGSGQLTYNKDGGTMMLALYTSQSMISIDCMNFNFYNCTTYGCQVPVQTSTIDYPDFNVKGGYSNAFAYIDVNYWNLTTQAYFARDCSAYKHSTYGTETYGLLGLGVQGEALNNFVTTQTHESQLGGSETSNLGRQPIFSFYMVEDGLSGELIFDFDETRASYSEPDAVFSADHNWNVKAATAITYGTKNNFTLQNSTVIFDINSDAIGLPLDTYYQLLKVINGSVDTLVCPSGVTYRPVCKFSESISYLPSITLTINGQNLVLPYKVYASTIKQLEKPSDSIVLNLRGLSPDNTDSSFATSTYSNFVILDQHVMGYYYTVFDTTRTNLGDNVSIKLYVANHGSSSKALAIILIGFIIGMVVGLGAYRHRMIKKARMQAQPMLETSGGNQFELNEIPGQRNRGYQELQ